MLRELVAKALLNKGLALNKLERPRDEEAAYQDLIDRFADDPVPVLRELVAKALRRKATTLVDLDRPQDALAAIEQAVAMYEELAEANPAAHQTDLDSARKRLAQIKTQTASAQQEPQTE